jgi:autotransporter-associated beta strand protein
MKKTLILATLLAVGSIAARAQTTNYFGTSGTVTDAVWSTNIAGPYTDILDTNGGAVINFETAVTAITGGSITVAGINANANVTNWTIGGTIANFTNGIVPINVAAGVLLDFTNQTFTSSSTAGYIKNGDGVVALAGNNYGGGFTLNAGTVVMRGVNAMGGPGSISSNNTLTLNGGILAASATRTLTNRYGGGIFINGNIQFGVSNSLLSISSDTANFTFNNSIDLGGGTRTITIGTGTRVTNTGIISNGGLILTNLAGATGRLGLFGASTYGGGTTALSGALLLIGTNSTVAGGAISDGPVGTGTLTLGTGALVWTDSTNARTLQNNLSLSGSVRFDAQARTNTSFLRFNSTGLTTPSTIALTGDTTIDTISITNTLEFDNSISGPFNLSKVSNGRFYLGASNSFSGTFTAIGGNSYLDANNALGSVISVSLISNSTTVISTGVDAINDTAPVTMADTALLDARGSVEKIASLTGSSGTALQIGEFTAGDGAAFTVGDSTSTTFAGVISGTNTNAVSILTKVGSGTLTLAGTNTYVGDTVVSNGAVALASTGVLRFVIGGSGTNNGLKGGGTTIADGRFAFDLAGASTNTNSTWTIVANTLTTTYGTNFLVTGFSGAGGNWTNTTNGVNYVFSQSNSVLSVRSTGGVTPYNAWVSYWQGINPGFTNIAGTANPDGDPFDNNEEFAFDGNPTIGTGALLTSVKVGTNAVFKYVAQTNPSVVTYQLQSTTNLAIGPWTNAVATISNSTNQSGISQTNIYLRKEFIVPATSNNFYRVQSIILP